MIKVYLHKIIINICILTGALFSITHVRAEAVITISDYYVASSSLETYPFLPTLNACADAAREYPRFRPNALCGRKGALTGDPDLYFFFSFSRYLSDFQVNPAGVEYQIGLPLSCEQYTNQNENVFECTEHRFHASIISPVNQGDCCDHQTPNPINIATGNKFFSRQDYMGTGTSPLKVSFYYNSDSYSGKWTSDYQQSLDFGNSAIEAKRPDGKILTFTDSNGVITAPTQRPERLFLNVDTYELTLADSTIEKYNTSGELLSIHFPTGITHTLAYENNIITVTRLNNLIVLNFEDDKLTSLSLPDSTSIRYSYKEFGGQLTEVTYADDSKVTYLYEELSLSNHITGILDENTNRVASVQYDSQGRAISSEKGTLNSGVERVEIVYHEDGSRTVTDVLGKQCVYQFIEFNGEYKISQIEDDINGGCTAGDKNIAYDTNGFVASRTDFNNNVTTYINDTRGLELSRTEAAGTAEERTITTEWHATFRLPIKITEPGKETIFTYDAQGRLLSKQEQAL